MHNALQMLHSKETERKDEETLMLTLIIEDLKICKQYLTIPFDRYSNITVKVV